LIFKKSFFSESSRRKKKKKKKKKNETSIEKKMSFFEAEGKTHNFPALASRNYLPNLWLKWDRTDRNALKREDCNAAFNQLLRLMKADAGSGETHRVHGPHELRSGDAHGRGGRVPAIGRSGPKSARSCAIRPDTRRSRRKT
jgi:hypothetical protein